MCMRVHVRDYMGFSIHFKYFICMHSSVCPFHRLNQICLAVCVSDHILTI